MKLSCRLFMETEDGVKRFEDCTEEELELFRKNASKRVSETMSRYFSQHPEELETFLKSIDDLNQ